MILKVKTELNTPILKTKRVLILLKMAVLYTGSDMPFSTV